MTKPKIIAVVGPNAAGKSALAVRLAKKFGGEVVSADSRQVYKGLDIGTGKISKKEMGGVRHHLLNVASPRRQFNATRYQKLAQQVIKNILARGRLPIICGGTGFYIQALVDNLTLPAVPPNQKLRARLQNFHGRKLFSILQKLDPGRAKTIDLHNRRRLIRAIEVARTVGRVPKLKQLKRAPYRVLQIGIKIKNQDLRYKIQTRLRRRLKQGMIAEVAKLHRGGLSWKRLDDFGLEYRYVAKYLQGQFSKQDLITQLGHATWHYAKRQMTWFRRDKRIRWVKNYAEAERYLRNKISKD